MTHDETLTASWQKFLIDFGQRVKAARVTSELSEEHVATALGLTVQAFADIERGLLDAEVTTVAALAKLLKTPVSDLLESRK